MNVWNFSLNTPTAERNSPRIWDYKVFYTKNIYKSDIKGCANWKGGGVNID